MKFKYIRFIAMMSLLMVFSNFHTVLASKDVNSINYYSNDFHIQDDSLNLLVNHIYTKGEDLIIDGYFYNSTDKILSEVSNLYLQLEDKFNVIFGKNLFESIPIDGEILPFQERKVLLILDKEKYNLTGKSLSKIKWKYKCDYK